MLLTQATTAAATSVAGMSIWDLCVQGGFIMIVLAVLSLICVYVFIERFLVIRSAAHEDSSFMEKIKDLIKNGRIAEARQLCDRQNSPYSRLIDKGIARIGRPMGDVLVAIENTGNLEVARLNRRLPWLATTAAGAPMLGFLGTVIGMVQSFYQLASAVTRPISGSSPMVSTRLSSLPWRPDCGYHRPLCLQLPQLAHQWRDEPHGGAHHGVYGLPQ